MTDVSYDLSAVKLADSEDPYVRFLDLLPVSSAGLLPTSGGFTPTIHAERLGAELGLPWLFLKNETTLPTGTTKDRMADVALPYLYERGVRRFATSSTGNSSSAYAHAIRRIPEMEMFIFTASQYRDRLTLGTDTRVIDVVLPDATFVEAFAAAGAFADENGVTAERGFFNPGRREGLKLAWLEAVEQVPRTIHWYVQAVSSAMGVYGVFKAARELQELGLADRPPRLLCVQEATCAPMASAWLEGSETIRPHHIVPNPQGIAAAIQRGDPSRTYPHIRNIVQSSDGTFATVSATEIREAQSMVEELEGVSVCFAAAAAVAGVVRLGRDHDLLPAEVVLVNLTGTERQGTATTARTRWLKRTGNQWDSDELRNPPPDFGDQPG
jgi:threonine synthase